MSSEKESVAPNVLAAIHSFNQINSWALEEVLTAPALSVRTATLEFFLRVLLELRELNNFSGMLALLAALDSNPISRLKDMWAGVPSKLKKHYEELLPLLNPMQNSRALREVQNAARFRNSPCVPHLGYYLSALYFADEGNPDQKVILPQDGAVGVVTPLINVRRCRLMAGLLDELRAFQKLPKYDLIPLPFVDDYLREIEVRVPSRWEELSTLILPRPDHSPAAPPPVSPKPLHASSPLATDGGSASLNTSNSSLNSTSSV
jgi:son of sevenless